MWGASLFVLASLSSAAECHGCHTGERTRVAERFAVGLGRWPDTACFGCHRELNDVARLKPAERDGRYWALPVSAERRARIATVPLSFDSAPEIIGLSSAGLQRLDVNRLFEFLRRPADVRLSSGENDRMLAYPRLRWSEMPDVIAAVTGELGRYPATCKPETSAVQEHGAPPRTLEAATPLGEQLWRGKCQACHERTSSLAGRPPAYLALFTAEWLEAYANGWAHSPSASR